MTTKLVGASVWEEELYEHLVSHEEGERALLAEYQDAAASSGSAAFRYLASLIIEDELRHHRIVREIAASLEADATLQPTPPDVPRLDDWGGDAPHLVRLTERLLDRERADARELHRLAKELKEVRDTTLWHLLVELMEADTAKHIDILEFVVDNAKH